MLVHSISSIPQGSVAMRFGCGGVFKDNFIANCQQSVPVKELLKLVNIWRRYGQKFGGTFFMDIGGVFACIHLHPICY